MTQITLGVAVSIMVDNPEKCPFCNSEEPQPKFEDVTITNDSSKLAKNLGGMPSKTMENPDAADDYYIHEKYWIDSAQSNICMNAHHIIPGNAAFAKSTAIRKWISGKNTVKKKFYDSVIEAKVKKVPKAQSDAKRAKLVNASYPAYVLVGPPDATVTYATVANRKAIHRDNVVNEQHVTGKVEFDVNCAGNGIWLPSNNAVSNWSAMKGVNATDENGDKDTFEYCYSFNAMEATGFQFHDAHEKYSKEVLKTLNKLEIEVKKLADACILHNNSQANKNQGAPFPAPRQLDGALKEVARQVSKMLDISKTTPKNPWITSDLAEVYK